MRIMPIGEMIAADIQDANLSQPLDDVSIAAITKAWNENLVLRFRNQHLSDADLIRFSSYFGELDPLGQTRTALRSCRNFLKLMLFRM